MPSDSWIKQQHIREVRKTVFKRDKHQCTVCGAKNNAFEVKDRDIWKIVLVLVHLNGDLSDYTESNLSSMCQRCALEHADRNRPVQPGEQIPLL